MKIGRKIYFKTQRLFRAHFRRKDEECDISRTEALTMASIYGLETEVKYAIDCCGLTPREALEEWDIVI